MNIVINLAVFITVWLFLSATLFRRARWVLDEREKKIREPKNKASDLARMTEEKFRDYETRIASARAEIKSLVESIEKETLEIQRKIISSAREEAGREIEALKKKINDEVGSARKRLNEEIPLLAAMIASRLIGRELRN